MVATPPTPPSPLTPQQRSAFIEICADAKAGFEDALDLVLIHNERDVRGNQPRRKLNPLTVLLAVAAWERFVVDVGALSRGQWSEPGRHKKENRDAYLDAALKVLGPASGEALPGAWRIRAFSRWRGKCPEGAVTLDCSDPEQMAELQRDVHAWINLRNKVAHRCMAQDLISGPYYRSDAETHTIQAGEARAALAEMLQLVDQSILAIVAASGFPKPDRFRLPAAWFQEEPPAGLRGVEEPGALWGGYSLLR
ncbi:hypothetical protein DLJ47_23310 [Micromonospora sp. S4605]|uniref:hypothetical protein n=1 Tax=Micromonospora sp. S4605 TaxID=1420897 RepID=UPI000D6F7A52|nr:hypothetical protein [Micromonospora sp. S4605]PWU50783.1 hypothetical protein DLJ47_23310 [Micromonospora sp. S4605]